MILAIWANIEKKYKFFHATIIIILILFSKTLWDGEKKLKRKIRRSPKEEIYLSIKKKGTNRLNFPFKYFAWTRTQFL